MRTVSHNPSFRNRVRRGRRTPAPAGLCPVDAAWKFLTLMPRDGLRRTPESVRRDAVILLATLAVENETRRRKLGPGKVARIRHLLSDNPDRIDSALLVRWMEEILDYPAKEPTRR
jgi:hypothetical protein